ncbi:MAG: 2-dehydropantoate 2-reductase [Verrucomicrobiota bacterium]|jgi:2-dehydropantoate 2-reductase
MKIAVVGCGAVGSYYGARFCRAGQDVHFLLRSGHDVVRQSGVTVRSVEGDFHVQPKCARTPDEIGVCDVVLIGLKTTANDQFPKLLPPLVGPRTAVVTLQNGLGNTEQLARLFPPEQVLNGLCFVCLNRLEPGVIHHMDYGLIVLGEYQRRAGPRTHELAAMFRDAGMPCKVTDNLAQAQWEKLVWNIPFNGLGVAGTAGYDALTTRHPSPACRPKPRRRLVTRHSPGPVLTTDKLLADPRWEKLLRELMLEVIATAGALGFEIPASCAEEQIERTQTMGAYKASTLLDFEHGRPLELESMFLEPLRRAQAAGVPVPRLAVLCNVLQQLDQTH